MQLLRNAILYIYIQKATTRVMFDSENKVRRDALYVYVDVERGGGDDAANANANPYKHKQISCGGAKAAYVVCRRKRIELSHVL